jgi:K+-sensing histidine kinase KdpD
MRTAIGRVVILNCEAETMQNDARLIATILANLLDTCLAKFDNETEIEIKKYAKPSLPLVRT